MAKLKMCSRFHIIVGQNIVLEIARTTFSNSVYGFIRETTPGDLRHRF